MCTDTNSALWQEHLTQCSTYQQLNHLNSLTGQRIKYGLGKIKLKKYIPSTVQFFHGKTVFLANNASILSVFHVLVRVP